MSVSGNEKRIYNILGRLRGATMFDSSANSYSLDRTVQAILRLQSSDTPVTHEGIASRAKLSDRHVRRCLKALRAQTVLVWERDPQWRGSGVRYRYVVQLDLARTYGYIDQDFLDLLNLTRERLMAQVA
jgi:predicted ArsR family transcriptional regulator